MLWCAILGEYYAIKNCINKCSQSRKLTANSLIKYAHLLLFFTVNPMNKLLIGSTLFAAACLCLIAYLENNRASPCEYVLQKSEVATRNRHFKKIHQVNRSLIRFTSVADTLSNEAHSSWKN